VRLAAPGEFTQRAFLSGRLDLTQAEAVHDLIAAQTLDQARAAAQQLGGALSRRVAPAKEQLVHLIALLEAGMDFASGELDDVDVVPPGEIGAAIAAVHAPLEALAATFRRGQLLRDGASIALVGRPNAGKSSLFNRLLQRERAIVTPIPGTTRDTLEESLSLGGIPLRLVDTAGLRAVSFPTHRDTTAMYGPPSSSGIDEVERLGMERTREAVADADLVLYIRDVSVEEDAGLFGVMDAERPHILVHNKIDLLAESGDGVGAAGAIRTSALTGAGLDELRDAILRQLNSNGPVAETGLLNTLRQQQAVAETLEALAAAARANGSGLPHEVILLDLHTALRALDSLTGVTTTEDILARIFSTFCIGK
jgi:tRNA modification GTPase